MSVSGSAPGPSRRRSAWSTTSRTSTSPTEPTPTATLPARHRCPALPNADEIRPVTVGSRSASSITTMWFFAPPSACTRFPCAAAVE